MVLDTSAVTAILWEESEAARFLDAIDGDPVRIMSAATLVECTMVLEGYRGAGPGRDLDQFLHRAEVTTRSVTHEQAEIARRAWRWYGKGNHVASLNLGDCFSYALAVDTGEPLLFKGNDFSRTDVVPAV